MTRDAQRPSAPPAALPPLPDPVRVSVVIPARDAADRLPACLAAVRAQVDDHGVVIVDRIVVAVGPSRDDTARVADRLAAEDARTEVVENPSGRTPDALNLAIAAADGDVVVRVDAQSVLPAGYVARAIATLRRTGAANVGGRQVPTAAGGFAAAAAVAMRSPVGSGGATYRGGGSEGPADTVYLGAFRREALDAVGGYDRRFVRNQDAELNERLRRSGFVVWFDPELEVAYAPRSTARALASQYLQYGRYRRLTGRVHPGSLQARQLAAPAVVAAGAATTVAGLATGRWWLPVAGAVGYLGAVGMVVARDAEDAATAARATAAVAIMHAAWGTGFLLGPPSDEDTGAVPADR